MVNQNIFHFSFGKLNLFQLNETSKIDVSHIFLFLNLFHNFETNIGLFFLLFSTLSENM